MKPAVLCIDRSRLKPGNQIYHQEIYSIPSDSFHFMNRKTVDAPDITIGQQFPQVIVYCLVYRNGKVLSYSRKKGAEERLHGTRSVGIGGHVDLEDACVSQGQIDVFRTIKNSMERELKEELSLSLDSCTIYLDYILVSEENDVSKVHVGLVEYLRISEDEKLAYSDEIYDPQWLTVEELKQSKDQYEAWSQMVIDTLGEAI